MSDLNDLTKPSLQTNYTDVPDTLLGHITRLWKMDYTGMASLVAGMVRASFSSVTGGLSMRIYRRNAANSAEEEVVSLPNVSIGGNAATATTASSCSGNAATATTAASCSGNAATATTAASCSGNAATATTAASCSGNAATATTAASCSGNAATATSTGLGGGDANQSLANGFQALYSNTTGNRNTADGFYALRANTSGSGNTAMGFYALRANTISSDNTAIGCSALESNISGGGNTAVGSYALYKGGSIFNTALGYQALYSLTNFENCTGVGRGSPVSGNNQVQLGNAATTTYVYGTVQNRSDLRDKADVRDTTLGLDFINALRPVDYRLDMREDYRPTPPTPLAEDASAVEKAAYEVSFKEYLEACKFSNIVRDGSKKRVRYHHGLIAQELKEALDSLGIEFGGFQDHKINGGDDVFSIGYDEFIGPLIKSVQQLSQANENLLGRLEKFEALTLGA